MTPAATLRRIAQEFREHPKMWTRGASAREANGALCSERSSRAVRWCQAGRRRYYSVLFVTSWAVNNAAKRFRPDGDPVLVNDYKGREATIRMLELAADMMEGNK